MSKYFLKDYKKNYDFFLNNTIDYKVLKHENTYKYENGKVKGINLQKMELGEPDERGRRRPVEKPDSELTMDIDTVIMSIGTSPNPLIKNTTKGLEVNNRGGIVVSEDGLTSREGVYAGGDAVTGAATVISAMGAGKTAAKAIDEAIKKKDVK